MPNGQSGKPSPPAEGTRGPFGDGAGRPGGTPVKPPNLIADPHPASATGQGHDFVKEPKGPVGAAPKPPNLIANPKGGGEGGGGAGGGPTVGDPGSESYIHSASIPHTKGDKILKADPDPDQGNLVGTTATGSRKPFKNLR